MIWKNKTYDVLKWAAQIALPALAVFWYAIAQAWNLPHAIEVQTTIIAIDTFMGALLGIAKTNYDVHADFSGIPEREDNR